MSAWFVYGGSLMLVARIDAAIPSQNNGLPPPKQAMGFEPRFAKQTKEFRHFSCEFDLRVMPFEHAC
jgi:hypothetical protein